MNLNLKKPKSGKPLTHSFQAQRIQFNKVNQENNERYVITGLTQGKETPSTMDTQEEDQRNVREDNYTQYLKRHQEKMAWNQSQQLQNEQLRHKRMQITDTNRTSVPSSFVVKKSTHSVHRTLNQKPLRPPMLSRMPKSLQNKPEFQNQVKRQTSGYLQSSTSNQAFTNTLNQNNFLPYFKKVAAIQQFYKVPLCKSVSASSQRSQGSIENTRPPSKQKVIQLQSEVDQQWDDVHLKGCQWKNIIRFKGSSFDYITFSQGNCVSIMKNRQILPQLGQQLYFKFTHHENRLVKHILEGYGFQEMVGDSMPASDNNLNSSNCKFLANEQCVLIWSSNTVKSSVYQNLGRFQKINHFPRSYELTRKDLLYERLSRMQALYGTKNFDFLPQTFNCPQQNAQLQKEMTRQKKIGGNCIWIMKPKASSQGKGISVIENFDEVPRGAGQEPFLVQQYIKNPILIEGFKYDLRIYVAITSVNPLRLYVYEEGICRFATVKYNTNDLKNVYSHLTNYSINKKNEGNVQGMLKGETLPDQDQNKVKWSLKAYKKYLSTLNPESPINIEKLFSSIDDIIIKTVISGEPLLWNGVEMFVPNTYSFKGSDTTLKNNNCFELLGFDILIDENLKPWLLEVNLSPSLSTDSLLDFKIKCAVVSDLLSMVGLKSLDQQYIEVNNVNPTHSTLNEKPQSLLKKNFLSKQIQNSLNHQADTAIPFPFTPTLKQDILDYEMIEASVLEHARRGQFRRLFPSSTNHSYYSNLLEERRRNDDLLHQYHILNKFKGQPVPQMKHKKTLI